MDERAIDELKQLADRFINGEDRSVALANKIEGLIIEEFSDANFFDDLILSLSLYRPGGESILLAKKC